MFIAEESQEMRKNLSVYSVAVVGGKHFKREHFIVISALKGISFINIK